MDIIYFNEKEKIFKYSGRRPKFIASNGSMQESGITETVGTDICHSISFHTIVTALTNVLNYFQCVKVINDLMYGIAGIIVSVKSEKVDLKKVNPDNFKTFMDWFQTLFEDPNKHYFEYQKPMDDICTAAEALFDQEDDFPILCIKYYMAAKASEIAELLNGEMKNLRRGYSCWNRSIGEAYDPKEWKLNENGFLLTDPLDNIRIANLLQFTFGAKIDKKQELIPGTQDSLFFFTFEDKNKRPEMCSSKLLPELWQPARELVPCEVPIYYKNYLHSAANSKPEDWPAEQIPTYIDDTT